MDLAPVVEAAIEAVRPVAGEKRIALETRLDVAAAASADPVRIQQVIWNLLSNAVKFTPSGGRIDVALDRDGAEARIIVQDTGHGISAAALPHIFDGFRQADSTSRRAHGGLGLAIARQLVELHGGTILAESPGDGLGATFTVRCRGRMRPCVLCSGGPPPCRASMPDHAIVPR